MQACNHASVGFLSASKRTNVLCSQDSLLGGEAGATSVAATANVSQEEGADAEETSLAPPRRLKLSFEFDMLDMKKVSLALSQIRNDLDPKHRADGVCYMAD